MTLSLVERASAHPHRPAIRSRQGRRSYGELLRDSRQVAAALLQGRKDLQGERVAFLVPADWRYVAIQWGIWRSGGVAVPLCLSHPEPELEYVVDDSAAAVLVAAPELLPRLERIAADRDLELYSTDELLIEASAGLPVVAEDRPAMIVYTSGTTGGPKGVVSSHANIRCQIESLVAAWEWRASDRILLVLPLHHVHGIVNVLACALWSGAVCEMWPRFEAEAVWRRFETGSLTLFMAVPTIYARLAAAWEAAGRAERRARSGACRQFRLMVSGSAALPIGLFQQWRSISGHTLLERYGMTETGMVLSNPLHGPRRAGYVGMPLPGVEVRRVDAAGEPAGDGEPAEIEVRGPTVFQEYWRRPQETRAAFRGGWFRTGDVAVVERGSYRILGRQSVDIIKTGGFKVSALEVEEVLRQHPAVEECAVVGLADAEWGERIGVAIEPAMDPPPALEELRSWCKERLAPYKIPTRLVTVAALPRNPMGKVTKPEVKRLFG